MVIDHNFIDFIGMNQSSDLWSFELWESLLLHRWFIVHEFVLRRCVISCAIYWLFLLIAKEIYEQCCNHNNRYRNCKDENDNSPVIDHLQCARQTVWVIGIDQLPICAKYIPLAQSQHRSHTKDHRCEDFLLPLMVWMRHNIYS